MPDTPSTSSRAVFLSYAREDAGAARRIAEALRASGVEVWFDENELRGGDAWDAKIRRQINDCTLFVPVISAHTQERGKGYFRLEWKLAVEQTHLMAEGMAFLIPVVVDPTSETGAIVPPEFLRVQWTRLPDGLPTPQFTRQVKQLLEAPRQAGPGAATTPVAAAVPPTPAAKNSRAPLAAGLAVAVLAAVALWYFWGRPAPVPAPTAVQPAQAAAPAAPQASDKSIAVLPFANMSEDKDAGFFADGVHEDLLTNLALIPELKVVSRTSVMQYRGTTKTMRQIGSELGVAYILEGSVRRAGNQVRVTGQLINTRTDEHVWAKNYDRDLTDIFSIQSALSQEIAGALSAAISPETRRHLERRPTENMAAYELFLKTRDEFNRAPRGNLSAMRKAEEMYQTVVDLDPKFAEAWGELANLHALYVFWGKDASPARLARGEAAIARARELAPEAPEIIGSVGTYAYYAHRDYAAATAQYARLAQLQPNNPLMHFSLGLVLRRQGHWAESLAEMKKAVALEPANLGFLTVLNEMCFHLRRWDEVRALRRRLEEMQPGNLGVPLWTATRTEAAITGSGAAFEAVWARLTPEQRSRPIALFHRRQWAMLTRNTAEFRRLDALQPQLEEEEEPINSALEAGTYLWSLGEREAAAARVAPFADAARRHATEEPGNPIAQQDWGFCQVLMGQMEAGLASLRTARQLMPTASDAVDGPNYEYSYLEACAMAGRTAEVLAGLPGLMRVPNLYPAESIRHDDAFYGLRDDPRFQAVLQDPANNRTPLY